MSFLAGVPGKLKTLQDGVTTLLTNFTSTIAGRVDATISSRAPSSTALSTATWTGTRAAYLDKLPGIDTANANPILASPIAINTPAVLSGLNFLNTGVGGVTVAHNGGVAAGYTTALNLTGRGVLNFAAVVLTAGTGGTAGARMTIDGNVVYHDATGIGTTTGNGVVIVGAVAKNGTDLAGIAFDQVPFNTSLLIEFSSSSNASMTLIHRYRKSR